VPTVVQPYLFQVVDVSAIDPEMHQTKVVCMLARFAN
jgi:hypothetical protein